MVEKIKKIFYPRIIIVAGAVLRIIYGVKQNPMHFQHDVVNKYGHLDYAKYIFENLSLPDTNANQFYQGPLNAIVQALFMKPISVFIGTDDFDALYTTCKILAIIYSILVLFIIYKIVEKFDFEKNIKIMILSICAVYPGMVMMAGQYNNDGLSYVFFFLSLYVAICWCMERKLYKIILLAISIGLGMLSKISVGLVAFVIGPMFLVIWIKSFVSYDMKEFKKITIQFLIFAVIVFPLGLSYAMRNLIMFNQPFNFVPQVAANTKLDVASTDTIDRFLSFPFSRFSVKKYGIFHAKDEYNIWIDLLKTSTYEEFNFGDGMHYAFAVIMLIFNAIFYITGFISLIATVIILVKKILSKKFVKEENLLVISYMLISIANVSYIVFNINYPYSCTSNYRYIMYITFAYTSVIAFLIKYINKRLPVLIINTFCSLWFLVVLLFVILV